MIALVRFAFCAWCVLCVLTGSLSVGRDSSAQQTLHRFIGDVGNILERLPHIHALGEHMSVAAEGTDIDNGDVDLTDLIPVSYTHLDVYKRQVYTTTKPAKSCAWCPPPALTPQIPRRSGMGTRNMTAYI